MYVIYFSYRLVVGFTVASRNNDRTVGGKAFAWRLLGMMPSISKAATVSQTDEWRADRRTRLYHSCIDILVEQINDLTGRDVFLRFGDQLFRRSRVFLDFLSMDGDEVSHGTMCLTVQCPSCWCPRDQLDDTDQAFPLRDTQEVYEETAAERKRLLPRNGQPRQGCKQQVSIIGISMVYIIHLLSILSD